MLLNLVFNVVPRPFTTAMIATEMPAAIRPYSMAVAPETSFTKRTKRFFIGSSLIHTWLSELIQKTGLLRLTLNHPGKLPRRSCVQVNMDTEIQGNLLYIDRS